MQALDLRPERIDAFLAAQIDDTAAAEFAEAANLDRQAAADFLADVASEARLACGLLSRLEPTQATRMLEVGAGAGLLAAFLHEQGADLLATEPDASGFSHHGLMRGVLAGRTQLPTIEPLAAEQLEPAAHGRFALIFSINVLEHMQPLRRNLDALAGVLAPGGQMLHTCPNYRVPYEPHYGIPLVPGRPALTGLIARRSRRDPAWQTLNWITAGDVTRYARRNGLALEFRMGELGAALERLRQDPAFARRQRGPLVEALRQLDRVGATRLLARLPAGWLTPMTFVLTKPA